MEIKKENNPKTLVFTLSEAIHFGDEGALTSTKELILYSPSRNELKIARRLKQILTCGALEISKKVSSDKEKKADSDKKVDGYSPTIVLASIYCRDESVDRFFDNFKILMCTQCCRLDDRVHMTASLFNKLTPEDEERLAGKYCSFFLAPSFL